ncbi:ABC transporter substrate-binding protein [Rhodococcus sp. NPDC057297]|uniref:ABC transporter substrate-binding protein n=1 Tax=Rhodococcus sp. NPDC057297 TaxID=3346090 RepID=UPI00363B8F13
MYIGSPTRRITAFLVAASMATALVGCSTDSGDSSADTETLAATGSAAAAGSFPVTIDSALGSATIDSAPTHVATWGWSNQDALLALGVVPVAMPAFVGESYGADAEGVLPWDRTALGELGAATPTLLAGDGTGQAPIEQFALAEPDLIFAPYSGISQAEFDALSEIAPVVAYPERQWTASWQEQVTIAGEALGKQAEAAAVVADTEKNIAEVAVKYPALKDKSITVALPNEPGVFSVSKDDDVRVEFLEQLGLVNEESIQQSDPTDDAEAVYFDLSYEKASAIASDVLFVVAYDKPSLAAFLAEPVIAELPVVADGRTASTESFSVEKNFAFGGLTVLTIPVVLDDIASALNAAAENVA